jgi:glycosyltransferase involved in cell wall biosynthesis
VKQTKKTLLVISPWESDWSLGAGAGVSDDYYFTRGFTADGFDIHFLTPAGTEESSSRSADIQTHAYPNFFANTKHYPRAMKRLLWQQMFNRVVVPRALTLARSLRPDFVLGHSHYTTKATCRCRQELGIPAGVKLFGVMDLVHTEWPRWKYYLKNFEQLAALRYPQDAWIVLDDGTQGNKVLAARGVPAETVFFLPNGVNLEWQDAVFDRKEIRADYGIDDKATVVLFLARLVASKRPEEVVRIISRVRKKTEREVLFLFAGDGTERSRCEAMARQHGIEALTKFVGIVPHADVPRVMAASDIFITTSSLTNMAIPTCEAFICGLPVVAYNIGDTGKVVIPGETGLLAEDKNRAQLADAVVCLINDDDKRRDLAKNARRFARDNFTSWDQRIQMELDIINRLIRQGR